MLDLEKWQEIAGVISKNKLRTFLTALGVIWGIFMLVFMMGFGNGLERGVMATTAPQTINACYVWAQRTTIPFKGLPAGRRARLRNADSEAIGSQVEGIKYLSPRIQMGGYRDQNNVTRGTRAANCSVYGDCPEFLYFQPMDLNGRFVNQLDMEGKRKVAVVGARVASVLFGPNENPIGAHIKIKGVYFKVIGVFRSLAEGEQAARNDQQVYVPFTTFQQVFNYGDRLGWFAVMADDGVSVSAIENDVKAVLSERHGVHPKDHLAFGSWNSEEEFMEIKNLFDGIKLFIWFVGICTLLAGVFGVSNIMLIAVKERTREIGIRKAMGATPNSIVSLVVQEALVLTSIAGYIGLIMAVFVLEYVGDLIDSMAGDASVLRNPDIDLSVALVALGALVLAGIIAGILPARHAARINPILALRS